MRSGDGTEDKGDDGDETASGQGKQPKKRKTSGVKRSITT